MIPILDMEPLGRYADGSPRYKFETSFPTRGVIVGPIAYTTPELAYQGGKNVLRLYGLRDPFGNMGEVCGVALRDDGYHYVVCLCTTAKRKGRVA